MHHPESRITIGSKDGSAALWFSAQADIQLHIYSLAPVKRKLLGGLSAVGKGTKGVGQGRTFPVPWSLSSSQVLPKAARCMVRLAVRIYRSRSFIKMPLLMCLTCRLSSPRSPTCLIHVYARNEYFRWRRSFPVPRVQLNYF
jgi:hypothetical protein